ncbi:MAG: sensor histidine kinase [Gemmatimonadales bacterium]
MLGGLLIAATLGLAGALAWQAARSAASHRAAAEASLTHHATIAAWRFAREGRSWLGWGMDQAGNLLQQQVAYQPTLPGPGILEQLLAEKECDCMTAGFARTVFRVVLGGRPVVDWLGERLSERARDSLAILANRMAADTGARPGSRSWRILAPGEPRLNRATDVVLLWRVARPARGARAVYGMVVEPEQIARPLRGALADAQFFPPSLVPEPVSDSLVHIEVAGPNRQRLFAAGPRERAFLGSDTLGRQYGALIVTAGIAPGAARLLAGGLPPSRSPTIVALLALTLGLGGAALALLRREQRLTRLREDFVSGVSHELRTPLTQIRVLSELLESGGFHGEGEKARATGVIHREALRLTNLVENVLEFARLRRPASGPAPGRVELADVARELAESFSPLLAPRGARLELAVLEDLAVPGERDTVARVLRNLIENAVKYGPDGQVIRVTIAGAGNGAARMMVDDEGPGIPADERVRIWQPYVRLERDRNGAAGGSGLGLAVVAELARLAGGRAWVEDAPGRGARFVVELPGAGPRAAAPVSGDGS